MASSTPKSATGASPLSEMPKGERIHRGTSDSSSLGRALFAALRLLDVPAQYALLTRALPAFISRCGGGTAVAPALSPHQLLLLSMTTLAALKHAHWALAISAEAMPPADAVAIAVFNAVFNSIGSLLFAWSATSAAASAYQVSVPVPFADAVTLPVTAVVGAALFSAGLAAEWAAEIQRRRFKRDARNKGRCYTGGLFAFARHPNYGGYVCWRAGLGLAASGLAYGGFVSAFFVSDFLGRGVPLLDEYCAGRYGEQWVEYKRLVRWRLFPGIV